MSTRPEALSSFSITSPQCPGNWDLEGPGFSFVFVLWAPEAELPEILFEAGESEERPKVSGCSKATRGSLNWLMHSGIHLWRSFGKMEGGWIPFSRQTLPHPQVCGLSAPIGPSAVRSKDPLLSPSPLSQALEAVIQARRTASPSKLGDPPRLHL